MITIKMRYDSTSCIINFDNVKRLRLKKEFNRVLNKSCAGVMA